MPPQPSSTPPDWPSIANDAIPPAVDELLNRLESAGFEVFLVGGCVRDLLRGLPVRDFDITTSASPEQALECFPRAIPIGLQHGTIMVPTGAGPVDVTTFRSGGRIEDDLAHRDFTVNAIAYHVDRGHWIDPHHGRDDLAAGVLRAVGAPEARLAEDPLRALRAVRLAVQLGLVIEPKLFAALAGVRPELGRVARERVRRELESILLASDAGRGVRLLRECGLEGDLAPDTFPDGPALLDVLPRELTVRLAAWLLARNPEPVLQRLRFPTAIVRRVARLLAAHPVDEMVDPRSGASLRRLVRRVGEENLETLFELREAELVASSTLSEHERSGVRARLDQLRATLAQIRARGAMAHHRRDLAIGGREVMEILRCGPSPTVGRALDYLTDCIVEEPACNTPSQLRRRLESWHAKRQAG